MVLLHKKRRKKGHYKLVAKLVHSNAGKPLIKVIIMPKTFKSNY